MLHFRRHCVVFGFARGCIKCFIQFKQYTVQVVLLPVSKV